MKNNGRTRRVYRKNKNEKRRLVMHKQNARKEKNKIRYGAEGGSALVMAKTTDFNRRFVAAFLALVFAISCLVIGVNFAVRAEVDDDGYNMLEKTESSMVLRKGLKENGDGTYNLRLEAYATEPSATKTYDADTPLDVVLVMDQSSTMSTKDVLTGEGYQEVNASSFTVSDLQNGEYYYYDSTADKYYPVSVLDRDESVEESYVTVKENGSDKTSWTAESARNWVSSSGKNVFYLNENDTYEKVWVRCDPWYKNAGTINANEFSLKDWNFVTNNSNFENDYYYNSEGDISQNSPFWHRVYSNSRGVTLDGFYIYLWYYTGSETGNAVSADSSSSSNSQGWSTEYWTAEANGIVAQLPNKSYHDGYHSSRDHEWSNGWENYDAWHSYISGKNDYIGGQLYTREAADSTYNYMYTSTDNGDTEIRMLAWPLSQDNSSSSTNPGSSTYNGVFYTAGYLPYYTDDNGVNHYIGTAVFGTGENSYVVADENNVPLYEKETMTRLEAEQLGATNLADQIAATVSEDADHRIAVVGFNNTGSVESGLVSATSDAIDTAISGLEASGTSSVAAGLTAAQGIFANNAVDPADSKKRIVVLFTDDDTVENAATSAAETLKDTYHASVYTIGYNKDGVSSAVGNWLDQLSSNYYASTQTNDGIDYYKSTTNKATILSAFDDIETALGSVTTTATLGTANSVLKDVISDNFIVDQSSVTTTVQTATANYPSGGELTWSSSSTASSVTPSWSGNTLTVSGFDYNTNYVAEGHNGQKIIVTITGLRLKDKVSSGADKRIYSNEATSGIYKTGDEDLLFARFLRPYVDDISNMAPAGGTGVADATSGAVVNKYLTPNDNGKYDLTLEAYTTMTNTTMVEKVPTDFVVVVDQSGSMSTADMPTGYTAVSSGKTIEEVAEGSYYVQAADGNYYRVYGTKDYLYRYYPSNYWFTGDVVDRLGTNLGWFMGETESSTTFSNQFYFREVSDGTTYYRPITTTIEGKIGTYYMKFHYDSVLTGDTVEFDREDTTYSTNGNSPWYHNLLNGNVMKSGAAWWAADAATQTLYPDDKAYTYSELASIRTGMYVNYPMYERHVGYTELKYRDVNGVEHTLAATNGQSQWEFCNADGNVITTNDGSTRPTYTGLYEASGTTTRLAALKNALDDFAQAVANETDSSGIVDNKIAIVGFSSDGYNNTEVLTKTDANLPSSTNGWQKATADGNVSEYYGKALVDATDGNAGTVNSKVSDAIDALTASGGTQPEDGLDMAYQILENRSETKYAIKYGARAEAHEEVDRNTIVIFFTDGQPGNYRYSDQYSEANEVVEAALPIKESGATVFSIGVFGESDGNPLTYSHERATSVDANWEYLGGWVENYDAGYYYYCLRREWRSGADGYTPTANDTIYDYMSVTSSNYPTAADYIAPEWLSGTFNGTYTQATDGVRNGSADTTVNNHYRMASNQDTLVAAFAQAVTMMNDTISENVRLDSSAILRDVLKNSSFKASDSTIVSASTVNGTMDKNGVVTFDSTGTPITLSQTPTYTDGVLSSVDIKGFDYLANYINYGTQVGDQTVAQHEGKKLVVTITDVYPDGADASPDGDTLVYSNQAPTSALYAVNNGAETRVKELPEPAITRHSYTLNVGEANPDALFDVKAGIVNSSGNEIDLTDSDIQDDLKDVMIVLPDGTRYNYLSVGPQTYENMANGESFYFENVPQGYQVKTEVTSLDDAYVYSIRYDNTGTAEEMTKGTAKTNTFDYDNHVINITSVRSTKNVTIWEQTIGAYAYEGDVFEESITMEIPLADGESAADTYTYPCTYNGESGYTATFTKTSESDGTVVAALSSIQKGQTSAPVADGKLSMTHDDTVTFTVPTGNTVKVTETTTNDYDVSYYNGHDDVESDDITLTMSDGTPVDETVTLVAVNGVDAPSQTLTFDDGAIPGSTSIIDLAPYAEATFTSDTDIGYPILTIAGTRYTFTPEEQQDGSFLYSATIKPSPMTPPVSVTVDKTDMDILIVNEKGDIPITGIAGFGSHNWIIYVLAAAGVLAVAGAGIFLWKKKDEFV